MGQEKIYKHSCPLLCHLKIFVGANGPYTLILDKTTETILFLRYIATPQ